MYSEVAYFLGISILALGTAIMAKADLGMSMVVAPAYLFYLKISQTFSFFSFGMAEYCLQAILLIILAIISRRIKLRYFLSFVTAVFYGIVLDISIAIVGSDTMHMLSMRIVLFVGGLLLNTIGVSLLFHTYIAPEAYELFVKEISDDYKKNINVVKVIYDCSSCALSILLSFIFFGFGHFVGVNIGTIIAAFLNGLLIGCWSKLFEIIFDFRDCLKFGKYFE